MLHTRSPLDAPLAFIRGSGAVSKDVQISFHFPGAHPCNLSKAALILAIPPNQPPCRQRFVLVDSLPGDHQMASCRQGQVARHFRSSAQPKLQAAKGVPGSGSGAFIWELLSHMVPDCDCAADLGDICKIVKGGLEL